MQEPASGPPGFVITGASSGIGRAVALQLARRGAALTLLSRDPQRGALLVGELAALAPAAPVQFMPVDLSSLADVRRVAAALAVAPRPHAALIHNAAVVLPTRELTTDGLERMFAVNHLAPFLLTSLLLDRLLHDGTRIVTVASQMHARAIDWDNLQGERRFDPIEAYRLSKLANILFSRELARRLASSAATAVCLHPGVVATPLLAALDAAAAATPQPAARRAPGPGRRIGRAAKWVIDRVRWRLFGGSLDTAETAARRIVDLATRNRVDSGAYYHTGVPAPQPLAGDTGADTRLWEVSAALTRAPA
jgi:NAD(P)-dependent dehydrogenase (short-subunit alcohol dehydrogenase family)